MTRTPESNVLGPGCIEVSVMNVEIVTALRYHTLKATSYCIVKQDEYRCLDYPSTSARFYSTFTMAPSSEMPYATT